MTISNDAFNNYVRDNISPKETEKNIITKRYNDLSGMLKGNNFQSGSYARFTAITPVNDLDVIWELPDDVLVNTMLKEKILKKTIDPAHLDISDVLSELAKKLREEYKKRNIPVLKIEAQTHSVGIYFGPTEDDFSMDIVPAVPDGVNDFGEQTYLVPEIIKFHKNVRLKMYSEKSPINWIKSDPRGYIKEATILNDANDNYRHSVKFCKKWKWHLTGRYPNLKFKSFHIEMIIKDLVKQNKNSDSIQIVQLFFTSLSNYIDHPQIPDRTNNGRYVDDYLNELTQNDKNLIINDGTKALLIMNNINDDSDVDKELYNLLNNNVSHAEHSHTNRNVSSISRPYAEPYDDNA